MKVSLPIYNVLRNRFSQRTFHLSLGVIALASACLFNGHSDNGSPALAIRGMMLVPHTTVSTPANRTMDILLNGLYKTKTVKQYSAGIIADTIKGSNWYTTVMADVKRKSYFMVTAADSANSCNLEQGLNATYRAGSFTLSSMQTKDELPAPGSSPTTKPRKAKPGWQFQLTVDGLYADNKPAIDPTTTSVAITNDTTVVSFHTVGMTTQYVNTAAGVRQNFIIDASPAANTSELRVKLHTSKNWVVGKAHDRELHFAQRNKHGGLDTKIIYNDLNVWDADGRKLEAKMEVGKDNKFDIVVAALGAKYPVTIDPLSTTPATTLYGAADDDGFGTLVTSAGDVNGDGYSDVMVTNSAYNSGAITVFVYHGSATGLSATVAKTLTGVTPGDNFAYTVASAGDVNGDGYSDVVVGASGAAAGMGAAYLYYGSATGLPATATLTLNGFGGNFAFSVASAGDVNGDGYSDVIVGTYGLSTAYVYHGSATGLNGTATRTLSGAVNSNLGSSVASAGDVNGDGYGDVVVGGGPGVGYVYHGSATGLPAAAALTLTGAGLLVSAGDVNGDGYGDVIYGNKNTDAAYVYYGSATGLPATRSMTLNGPALSDFGFRVASAGDVNGDGYGDVVVGATRVSGAAYIYYGSATGLPATPSVALNGAVAGTEDFGYSVAAAGDVNGDGYCDVVVGAPLAESPTGFYYAGAAYVFHGSATGTTGPTGLSTSVAATVTGGTSVASAGDVNGDGYSDVVVGNGSGNVAYIYHGSATGLSTITAATLNGFEAGSNFGRSAASAGDVNGDGYDDVIVGANRVNNNIGAAYVYYGSATGLSATPATTLNGTTSLDYLGWSVASAGDVNGDGYGDVIMGGYAANGGIGKAWVYHGSSTGLSPTPAATLIGIVAPGPYPNNPSRYTFFGYSVASAGDVNGDGYSDVIVGAIRIYDNLGAAYVYYGSATGVPATPSLTMTGAASHSYFGTSVASAGDVNGDGYNDVVIGAPGSPALSIAGETLSITGLFYVYHGSATGLSATAALTLTGGASGHLGWSVASAGDVNGDGYSDVVSHDRGSNAYVYHGSPTGMSATVAATLNGGNNAACAGDVNGDGASDVVVGTNAYYGYRGGKPTNSFLRLRLLNTNLNTLLTQSNVGASQFGAGLSVSPIPGSNRARILWQTATPGGVFAPVSPTTNLPSGPYTVLSATGGELKALITKTGRTTRFRVRAQYYMSELPTRQVFGPWVYLQAYLTGEEPWVLGPPSNPLPVKLMSFAAHQENAQRNQLGWTTASEDPGLVYSVTRSGNGKDFESLGIITGKGSAGNYTYFDEQPLSGTNYYRLTMVEANGNQTYSNVAIISRIAQAGSVTVSPVPATSSIRVVNTNVELNGQMATVTDMQGRVVWSFQFSSSNTIDVQSWPVGIYSLNLASGHSVRLVKQ